MLYFANPSTQQVRDAMSAGLLGCIVTPAQGNRIPPDAAWCADNGRFGKGWPGDDAYLAWLEAHRRDLDRCVFAVAPDEPCDMASTLRLARTWLPRIRDLGYPVALAVQDGAEPAAIPWGDVDVVFIGGSTAWKLSPHAARIAREAGTRGRKVHMGRVNSRRRLRYADAIGCSSADGTYLAFGPDVNLPRLLGWLHESRTQEAMF